MTGYCETSLMSSMNNFTATYFYDRNTPTIINKQLSSVIVIDTIRNFIAEQYEYTFGAKPAIRILEMLVDGFLLFNLHKNKYMLKNKEALLNYVNNKSISIEEKEYFLDIFLFNQRPQYLSVNEHEYLRACGDLKGFNEFNNKRQYNQPKSKFCSPTKISNELADFLGRERGTEMARTDVTREINKYIRVNKLQDKDNGRMINPNEKLSTLFKLNPDDELTYFNIQRYISQHVNC
jgi:hypothetical protein